MLEIDEALEVLDHYDVEEVTNQQKIAQSHRSVAQTFKSEYIFRARTIREQSGKKGKAKKAPAKVAVPAHIPQKDAKKFLRPGAFIWLSNIRGEWNAHCAPSPRIYEPFARRGGSVTRSSPCLLETCLVAVLGSEGLVHQRRALRLFV